ncbi:hypothetical protein ABG79_01795 [Caloramator mitchellensis]|uniref:Uncharacterized protein n=1 Tax=Caloramator mitchellensis TaxID=908809 RepID=A0A0R3JYU6_CALMK|nr:hypothetical protein ABG79_01795 [Caloramator mitchellensis]
MGVCIVFNYKVPFRVRKTKQDIKEDLAIEQTMEVNIG